MGVYESRGTLAKAMKELNARWLETRGVWDDVMAETFEKDHLVPLDMDLRSAIGAMEHISQIIAQVKRDCS